MNQNEIQIVWKARENNFTASEQKRLIDHFTRQMARRRRFQVIWLTQTFIALAVVTIIALRSIALGHAQLDQQWALLPLLTVPWLFAFHFLRRFLKPSSPITGGEKPIASSLHAALDSNAAERSRLKLVALLFAIMVPLLWVSARQLSAVGKVSPSELVSMLAFFGGVLFLSAAGIAARYFVRLVPQQRRLKALLVEISEKDQ